MFSKHNKKKIDSRNPEETTGHRPTKFDSLI